MYMKKIIINNHNLSANDTQIKEDRVKVLIINSKGELLLCKINGVYHFVGGHIENGESLIQCAKRETMEESGLNLAESTFSPFLQLTQYEKNYYKKKKNCLSTITYMEGKTDTRFDYSQRKLDSEEAKKDFQLSYVSLKDIIKELESNREAAKKR